MYRETHAREREALYGGLDGANSFGTGGMPDGSSEAAEALEKLHNKLQKTPVKPSPPNPEPN